MEHLCKVGFHPLPFPRRQDDRGESLLSPGIAIAVHALSTIFISSLSFSGIHPLQIPARRPSNDRVGRKLIRSRREKTNDLSSLPDRPLRVHSFPGFLLSGYVKSPYAALRFLLPLGKLRAGLFPVTVSHVMVILSNHACLASGAFQRSRSRTVAFATFYENVFLGFV
jgi:hypothetical protein